MPLLFDAWDTSTDAEAATAGAAAPDATAAGSAMPDGYERRFTDDDYPRVTGVAEDAYAREQTHPASARSSRR